MSFFFFFNDTATTEIYTLSLHDALPIFLIVEKGFGKGCVVVYLLVGIAYRAAERSEADRLSQHNALPDRKSTRLNSSHANISYAVFCLKKKTNIEALCSQVTHIHRTYSI